MRASLQLVALQAYADQLRVTTVQQADIINQQSLVIQQQQAVLNALPQTLATAIGTNNAQYVTPAIQTAYQAIVGGTSAQGLYTLQEITQHLAADETGVTQLLAQVNADRSRFAQLEPLVAGLGTGKADVSALNTLAVAVGGKASAADLAGVKTAAEATAAAVSSPATGLSATNALAATNAAGLATANTAISNRLRKDQADATTFPLAVPVATGMDKAVQKSELVGGIQRPYRVFQNVGAAPVGAYVRSGQSAQIADTLGLGQAYALTSIRIKALSAATLAATIRFSQPPWPWWPCPPWER